MPYTGMAMSTNTRMRLGLYYSNQSWPHLALAFAHCTTEQMMWEQENRLQLQPLQQQANMWWQQDDDELVELEDQILAQLCRFRAISGPGKPA